jgi:two-component system, OmpR family, sensor histidine kinase KdpD
MGARRVVTRVPPDLPLVPVDPILIEQALVNLLENAAKYTPPETTVVVEAHAGPAEVVVVVSDDGPGLPAGQEERIFEKFYQPAAAAGFGLGLAICRAVMEAHGGSIRAENAAPHGAAFRFTLPLLGTPPPMITHGQPTS